VALFPNAVAAQVDYYKRTGVYPSHHIVAIKEELARRAPWLVENLCNAFQTAKELSRKRARPADPSEFPGEPIVGLSPEETEKLFGPDPLPYGITPNRKTLEAFFDGAKAQGLTRRRLTIEEFFVPQVPAKFR
jgi:4,5-dihydroxyphthalate decarboxylase